MADVFARVLLALDEEVISLEIPRGPEELAVSMRIKDAMRGACVFKVVDAVRDVVAAHHVRTRRPRGGGPLPPFDCTPESRPPPLPASQPGRAAGGLDDGLITR